MARRGRIGGLAGALCLILAGEAAAQVPPPPALPKPGSATAPDQVFETAKAAFEALPETERKRLQDALVWTGDYNSVVTGAFGRRTYDALLAAVRRAGDPSTGLPDAGRRGAILAAGEAARTAARFAVKPDPASGAVIGVPERLLPKRSNQPSGTRWQSADGRVTLDTKSFVPGETDLDALFGRITAPAPDRRVTYKLKRPDFLVATAETATGKSYIRYAAGAAGIRGFTVGYDKALSGELDRVVIAVANSYVPFPEEGGAPSPAPAAAQGGAPKAPAMPSRGLPPAATGLVVASDRVITSAAAVEACAGLRVDGAAARIVKTDPARTLVLVETGSLPRRAVARVSPRTEPSAAGDAVVVLGADFGGSVAVAPGETAGTGERIVAPLQPGAAGAPVFDRSGALAGLVLRLPPAPRLVAGVVPPMSYALIPGRTVGAFLSEAAIASGKPAPAAHRAETLGGVAGMFAEAVVGIDCQP